MKLLRKSLDLVLDRIFISMNEDEAILFLQIFKRKLEQTLSDMQSTFPSGEINNKE